MQHYIDIRLRADPEVAPAHVMAALYTRLHRLLVKLNGDSIGVSFPGYDARVPTLGTTMRLFGPLEPLEQLVNLPWLGATRDHVEISQTRPVPPDAPHRALRRVQVKSGPARLRKRLMKRHQLSESQALERIPDSAARHSALPFVSLTSASTGQQFRLFLELGAESPQAIPGAFNFYGLSAAGTVPWF